MTLRECALGAASASKGKGPRPRRASHPRRYPSPATVCTDEDALPASGVGPKSTSTNSPSRYDLRHALGVVTTPHLPGPFATPTNYRPASYPRRHASPATARMDQNPNALGPSPSSSSSSREVHTGPSWDWAPPVHIEPRIGLGLDLDISHAMRCGGWGLLMPPGDSHSGGDFDFLIHQWAKSSFASFSHSFIFDLFP
ncbi:hypothetical protein B0H19DRAFT_1261795 [Mycena capillaripes]|nr:hypothetical protein B0H19DRAFT_1261795 [Mycena capillaripes]